ncbi:MAG TPA: SDR family oxidoreductase [Acidimicrobiia bacterium]|nr:SDR family oxidoreductase [Acidimicrobiia bacterium]
MATDDGGALRERAVIVTGGGTGIGAACAAELAAHGARVTICGRTASTLEAAASRIADRARHGGSVRHVVADVTVEDDVARVVDEACRADGALRGVVANAGGGGGMGPYHLQDVGEFTRVLHLNVLGTMLCLKHALPRMVAAGGGSFVGMSSIAGHVTHPYFGAYPVAKAAIEEMMRNAADEYGPVNVRCNAVRPGFIATEIMEGIPRDSPVYASYIENTPLGGVGEPEDVARLVRFLVSDEARWITGQVINVDGGHSLRRGPDFSAFIEPALGRDAMLAKVPPPV